MRERVARVASSPLLLITVLCFLLPFFTISCGGTTFVTCSGVQSVSGSTCSVNSDATKQFDHGSGITTTPSSNTSSANTTDGSFTASRILLGLAGFVILGGMVAGIVLRGRIRGSVVAATSGAAVICLVAYAFAVSKAWTDALSAGIDKMNASAPGSSDSGSAAFGASIAKAVISQFHEGLGYGFWIVEFLLFTVLVINGLSLTTLRLAVIQAPPSGGGGMPPVAPSPPQADMPQADHPPPS